MKKEYLKCTVEELIEDRQFVAWVLREKNQKEWELFLAENPDFKITARKARKIIKLLSDNSEHLSENEILKIWKNIDKFDDQVKANSRSIRFTVFLKYAAVFILALSLGAVGYWMVDHPDQSYVFTSGNDQSGNHQSRLSLADGTTIDLEKENSKIALNADQKIVIDNEQVIDLKNSKNHPDQSKMNEVVIPFGKKSQLILEDGTKVWLNAGSRMAFPTRFEGKKREVFLEGEAYFEVAHNKEHPFFVNTNHVSVKVLGTKFNVSAYKSDQFTETILLEGKVSLREQAALGFLKNETILLPRQKASYNNELKTMSVKNDPDVELAVAWTEGWFRFSQQSLDGILNKLQRYYNVKFVFDPSISKADLITGKLDLKDSIEKVMVALSDVAKIQFRINGDQIFIEKKLSVMPMK